MDVLVRAVRDSGNDKAGGHILIRHYADAVSPDGGQPIQTGATDAPRSAAGWPLTAPTTDELARAHGREPSPYLFAVSTLRSDFENYIIKPACQTFALPDQERLHTEQATASAETIEQLVRQLTAERPQDSTDIEAAVRELVQATVSGTLARRPRPSVRRRLSVADSPGQVNPFDLDGPAEVLDPWAELGHSLGPGAVETVRRLEQACWHSRFADRPIHPDHDLLGRWIAQRVLDLGWTTDRFGDIDARLAGHRSYGSNDSERFAKKYTWIAFHQVLGLLGDYCTLLKDTGDQTAAYRRTWQINGVRDTDPSLALRGDQTHTTRRPSAPSKSDVSSEQAWWLRPSQHSLSPAGDPDTWIAEQADIPDHLEVLRARDPFGEEWLAVENHSTWQATRRQGGEELLWREQWMRSQAYLISQSDMQRVKKWASKQHWQGLWMPTPSESSPGFIGEYPDLGPWPDYLSTSAREASGSRNTDDAEARRGRYWSVLDTHGIICDMAMATAVHAQRSGRDRSTTTLSSALLPSSPLLGVLEATWAPAETEAHKRYQLGASESEYSWQSDGRLVAFATAGDGFGTGRAVWARAEPLRAALAEQGLVLWAWTLGEKCHWLSDEDPYPVRTDISGACLLGPQSPATWAQKAQLNSTD